MSKGPPRPNDWHVLTCAAESKKGGFGGLISAVKSKVNATLQNAAGNCRFARRDQTALGALSCVK